MASVPSSSLRYLYFAGKRVRLTPIGAAKLQVPVTVIYGLILKLIDVPGFDPKVLVEFETLTGDIISGLYHPEDLEGLPIVEDELKKDLMGRRVHFPRSSGIGISFPPDATDYGIIADVRWKDGKVKLVVHVETDGQHPDAPFVTPADFSQCDLLLRRRMTDTE